MKTKELIEGLSDDAHLVERDHEVQMARAQLYNLAGDAIALHKALKNVSEEQGLDGWVQSKITLAQNYIAEIKTYMDGQNAMPDLQIPAPQVAAPVESVGGVSAGGIAAVAAPLGQKKKMIRR